MRFLYALVTYTTSALLSDEVSKSGESESLYSLYSSVREHEEDPVYSSLDSSPPARAQDERGMENKVGARGALWLYTDRGASANLNGFDLFPSLEPKTSAIQAPTWPAVVFMRPVRELIVFF